MANIKYLKDSDGNIFYPVVHADGIFDSNGNNFKFWFGTQEEYEALEIKESNTIYLIKEG